MPLINWNNLFTKAERKVIKLAHNESYTVPPKTTIMILGGKVGHVTGANSLLVAYDLEGGSADFIFVTGIPSASANGNYPLFNTNASELQAQYSPVILEHKDGLKFTGGTGSNVRIIVLEW